MLKLLTKRERVILFLTIGVIVLVIIFNLFLMPALKRNEILHKEIFIARNKLKKYLALLKQKDNLNKPYGQSLARPEKAKTEQDILMSALSELEALAKTSGIQLMDIRPQGVFKVLTSYREAVIDLRSEGTIENYLKFIHALESSPSLLKIKRYLLNAKPNTPYLEGSFSISQLLLD